MNYFLVDFENVKTNGIKDLNGVAEGDAFIIFYSENCKNTTIELLESITQMKLKFKSFKVKSGTKNALDFQLSSYLGNLIGKSGNGSRYYIVSKDKGYDCLGEFWKGYGVSVERISLQESGEEKAAEAPKETPKKETPKKETPKKEKKAVSKVAAGNLATLEEIRNYLSEEDMPEDVLAIFNQYKSKQAICNGISKKCKDSKRTSAIYKKLKPLLKEKKKS